MPRTRLLRSITSESLDLPIFARWERPSAASFSVSRLQPGRFAQGPEEKQGFLGSNVGFMSIDWFPPEFRAGIRAVESPLHPGYTFGWPAVVGQFEVWDDSKRNF